MCLPIFQNYLDQKTVMMKFNLTSDKTTFNAQAGWIRFNGKIAHDLQERKSFTTISKLKDCKISLHTQLYNYRGEAIGFNQKSYQVSPMILFSQKTYLKLQLAKLDVIIQSENCKINLKARLGPQTLQFKMPLGLLLCCLVCLFAPLRGIMSMIREHTNNVFFLNNVSYWSVAFIGLANFKYFGVLMIMGLGFSQNYFQFLSISALLMFLASVIIDKFAKAVYRHQNSTHPNIDIPGFSNPLVRFQFLMLTMMVFSYLACFVVVTHSWFVYYIWLYYLYPLVHIFNIIKKGTKNSFRW